MGGYKNGKVEIWYGDFPPSNLNILWQKRIVTNDVESTLMYEYNNNAGLWQVHNVSELNKKVDKDGDKVLISQSDINKIYSNEEDIISESSIREDSDIQLQSQISILEEQLASATGALIYQDSVTNFEDLATEYPIPELYWAAMVTSLGYIHAWNGVKWANTGLREFPEGVATKNLLTSKPDVKFANGVNMLNINSISLGYIDASGEIIQVPENKFYHSDFIPVDINDVLLTNEDAGSVPKIALYNQNFQFVSAVDSETKRIVATENGYIRISIFSEDGDFSNVVCAKNFINEDNKEYNPISGYLDLNTTPPKIGLNLLNPDKINTGYIDSSGEVVSHPEFYHSEFIPVDNGDILYTSNDAGNTPGIALYNENFEFVSSVNASSKQITATENGFVRFSLYSSNGVPNATISKNINIPFYIQYNPISGYLNTTKKILWLGTSIPEGCEYPIVASANNGAICFNRAVGGSGIVLNTGILGNGRDGKDLTETISEKVTRYSGNVSSEILEVYKLYSYENLLMPYLYGENKVDVIVIDHGFNDREDIANEIAGLSGVDYDITSTSDRSTFTGAFKFLLNKIYTADPKIKVIIGGYMEKVSSTDKRYGSEIYTMHKKLSDVYGIPYLDVANLLNFTFNHAPGTSNFISDYNTANGTAYVNGWPDASGNVTFFQYFNPDSVHPFTDKSGESNTRLNLVYTKLLRNLI